MAFLIDKQTLDDLNIFGRRGQNSIYQMFCITRTRGGAKLLEDMFRYPLDDAEEINRRSRLIQGFLNSSQTFVCRGDLIDMADAYLQNTDTRTIISMEDNTLQRKLKGVIGADSTFEDLHKGILACVQLAEQMEQFVANWTDNSVLDTFNQQIQEIKVLLKDEDFVSLRRSYGQKKLSYEECANLDRHLRFSMRDKLLRMLRFIYYIDVYQSVAEVSVKYGFCFAEAVSDSSEVLKVEDMYHPGVSGAVANSLSIDSSNNVLFLTGANMAGKSTFMKTLGTVMFLAHAGFPVPARFMRFSVLEGMFTTINLPDNLAMGYSHYYAEVLRVKKVATHLSGHKRLMVIFDELFRGTNVKDAYDATVAITQAFARHKECLFVVSTHITEAGEYLRPLCPNINFVYMPTVMDGKVPRYTYKLSSGITEDRHGMVIIRNEGILNMLEDGKGKQGRAAEKKFITDKQTLEDLNMLGEFRANSIFSLFNKTHTPGGKRLLEMYFKQPLSDAQAINDRSSVFQFFQENSLQFPIDADTFQTVDDYYSISPVASFSVAFLDTLRKRVLNYISKDIEYGMTMKGVWATTRFLQQLKVFVEELRRIGKQPLPHLLQEKIVFVEKLLARKELTWAFNEFSTDTMWMLLAKRDFTLRTVLHEEMNRLMEIVYELDVYISVAAVAVENGFHIAHALPFDEENNEITIEGLKHPALKKAVTNDVKLNREFNTLFLTGANMAGKSTLMKSFSIAVYLAHVGLPVAASRMDFSVQDGLFTSINVADNLNAGYSHYYAEVLRVKHVAQEVASGKHLVVLFDELFKGTNVKDAYEATVMVTTAFAAYRSCSFIISTHIIEAGHDLKKLPNLHFVYVPTELDEFGHPQYLYRLREGITDDRHGMVIIRKEKILDLL